MPVIRDQGTTIYTAAGAAANEMFLVSLRDKANVPADAAVAIIYYVNTTTQGSPGKLRVADYWHPDMGEGASLDTYGWTMSSYDKIVLAVNLGPKGANPEKYIWCGLYYGATVYFYLVGYLTYDDIFVFPEVMSETRSDYYLVAADAGGLGGSWVTGNVYDFSTMQIQPGYAPQGLLWDMQYSPVITRPTTPPAGIDCDMQTSLDEGTMLLTGFDEDGQAIVYGNTSSASPAALMGYVKAPMKWLMAETGFFRPLTFITTDVDYTLTLPEYVDAALFQVYTGTTDWTIKRDSSTTPHTTVQGDSGTQYALVKPNTAGEIIININDDETARTRYHGILAYFLKYKKAEGEAAEEDDLEVFPPEFYYSPDNYGSLHINYSINGQAYGFTDVGDLKLYLSGGASNTDPDLSLGGVVSTTELASGLNSLFDDTIDIEAYARVAEYRCLYLKNESGSETARDIRLWVEFVEESASTMSIGEDAAGIDGTATTIAAEESTPSGVTFVLSRSMETCYTLPALGPGESIALWFMRWFDSDDQPTQYPNPVTLHLAVLDNA